MLSDEGTVERLRHRHSARERASLGAIAYHLGERRPIDEIDFLRCDGRRLELYQLAGFKSYSVSDLSMRELALHSALKTLKDSGLGPADIDVCLYVAESFDRDEPVNSAEVNRLLMELGLPHVVPMNVSVSNCANMMAAVRVAAALVQSGEARHVLITSVDKASRRYAGRMMFQEMSLKSDASVSCLVSGPGVGSYGIIYLGQHNAADLIAVDPLDRSAYAIPKFRGIRHAANDAKKALMLNSADFSQIITNNYGREVSRMFVELCGFANGAGWFENIGRFAHAVAGDILINLKDLEDEMAFEPGDRIFMMADTITTSSVLCLQRR